MLENWHNLKAHIETSKTLFDSHREMFDSIIVAKLDRRCNLFIKKYEKIGRLSSQRLGPKDLEQFSSSIEKYNIKVGEWLRHLCQ
jgi:hypothetical protein